MHHPWCKRLGNIGAVGAQIEHVDILQVGAVGEARVLQRHLQVSVRVARPQPACHIPEADALHVLVATEGTALSVVEFIVVERADVVEQAHRSVVLGDVFVVGTNGIEVLYGMTADAFLALGRVVLV